MDHSCNCQIRQYIIELLRPPAGRTAHATLHRSLALQLSHPAAAAMVTRTSDRVAPVHLLIVLIVLFLHPVAVPPVRAGTAAAAAAAAAEGWKSCQRHKLDRFHIIGHSKGGMIARHYVQHHGGDARAKSLITLGSPHHGTPTAALGIGLMFGGLLSKSPLQMLPGSALVKRMKADTFPPGIPLSSIYSKHDIICPWWCSKLHPRPGESSMRNLSVRGVGHTALTYDPGVYRLVKGELDAASDIWRERER